MRGKFIVVEGLDGSGKGTQTALLCAYLKSQGRNVYPTAEPTESVTGGMIRDVLSGARQRTSSELAALFLADRVAHNMNPVNGIEKTLEAGIANTSFVSFSTATTEGSRIMIPLSLQCTKVLAVPKSIPISSDILLKILIFGNVNFIFTRPPKSLKLPLLQNYNKHHRQ